VELTFCFGFDIMLVGAVKAILTIERKCSMKKLLFLGFLAVLSAAFLSGCTIHARVTGTPQIPISGGSGSKLGWLFPPNNIIVVVNGTTAPLVINVYEARGRQQFRLEAGQQTEIDFRQLYQSEAVVVVSIYDPQTGVVVDSASRQFYLTDNGGHVRVHNWIIRTSSSRRIIW